jgi:CO/xanthine dehydrogenase Mo-binding subunit
MMALSVVAKDLPRIDVLEKVTGKAKFCSDLHIPGMLHAKILRSPHPHAKILNIDTSKAEQLPGVRGVITGKDVPDKRFGVAMFDQHILPKEVVRYAGEMVAVVAADTVDIAEEAVSLIDVTYEPLQAIFDPEEAIKPDAPVLVHPDMANYKKAKALGGPRLDPDKPNVFFHMRVYQGDVDKGFREADMVVENRFTTTAIQHCALEPQVAIAEPAPDGGLVLWVGRQNIFGMRDNICRLFDLQPNKVRAIQGYVGGGFGLKNRVIVEPIVTALALKTGRPVKLAFTREEVFLQGSHKIPTVTTVKDGVTKDGKLVAREMKVILQGGAYEYNMCLITRNCSFGALGTYSVPNVKFDSYGVYTNEVPRGGFRGLGSNQTNWAVECQMDILAEKLGMDPVEFRRKNILKEGEPNAYGEITHSIGARECLDNLAECIKVDEEPQSEGLWKRGKAITLANKYSIAPTASMARVTIGADGMITVHHAADEMGQGCNMVAAQIVAEALGVSVNQIKVVFSDTGTCPYFPGSTSSRTTYNLGNALVMACQKVKQRLLEVASVELNIPADRLETQGGAVYVKDEPEKNLEFWELFRGVRGDRASLGYGNYTVGGEIVGFDTYEQKYTPEDPMTGQINPEDAAKGLRLCGFFGHMAKAVEVAVNVETGQVKVIRCGMAADIVPINPKMCEQQMEGGMEMGIGEALFEEIQSENGVIKNPNFTDYRFPTAKDMPYIKDVHNVLCPTPHKDGPFGAKGFSEGAMIGLQAAIANAIYRAIGVRIYDLPITPERILEALKKKS